MRELLLNMGIFVPKASEFNTKSYNNYDEHTLKYDFVEADGFSYCGTVTWKIKGDTLYELEYEVNILQATSREVGISCEGIARNLSRGLMSSGNLDIETVDELICLKCEVQYDIDSKGFYRPLYLIDCTADGESVEVKTSAI